jgi:hypothetical protein
MWRRIWYRVSQFFHALTARASPAEVAQAIAVLPADARVLFGRQSRADQCHALAVWRSLRRSGYSNPKLLSAALLHDVGKAAARFTLWQRATIVALERFAPRALQRLGRDGVAGVGQAGGWRHPFVVTIRHAELGARWAEEAGCSQVTVTLIRRHQDRVISAETEVDRLLAALQTADDAH